MSSVNLESLLSPLEPSPGGENLEYDPDFLALEQLASPKAERAIGDSVKAAEEPDWIKVAEQASAILGRSKDLRVAIHLTVAWLRTTGPAGWSTGLALVHGMLERFWDELHPQLDAEDDNDPTARVSAASALGDPLGPLGYFRAAPFVKSPRLGPFSLRDLRIANGSLKIASTESGAPTLVDIEACCMDCPEDELVDTADAIGQAYTHAGDIDRLFTEKLGTAGPDLKLLLGDIHELKAFLDAQLTRRFPERAAAAGAAVEAGADDPFQSGAVTSLGHRIENPQDVARRLEELCEYYARNEPSSPIPLLLRRAQRLVGLSFTDLMKDLAPGGISELRVIAGPGEDDG